jgi:hypothetical protein
VTSIDRRWRLQLCRLRNALTLGVEVERVSVVVRSGRRHCGFPALRRACPLALPNDLDLAFEPILDLLGEVFQVLADAGLLDMELGTSSTTRKITLGLSKAMMRPGPLRPSGAPSGRVQAAVHVADFEHFAL